MGKHVSPLLGYNNNVRHKNRVFHIQTEDSGVKHPHIITHLFMDGGRILKSVKRSYAEHVGADGMQEIVKQMMKEQHKAMFIALRDGQFDQLLDGQGAGSSPSSKASHPKLSGHPSGAAPAVSSPPAAVSSAPKAVIVSAPAPPIAPAIAVAARTDPMPPPRVDDEEMVPMTTRTPELTLDMDALERAAASGVSTGSVRPQSDLPPPPANLFREKSAGGKYRSVPPPPPGAAASAGAAAGGVGASAAAPAESKRTPTIAPKAPPPPAKVPGPAKPNPSADNRYAAARPAAIFGQSRPQTGSSIFGEDLISDKSLDEVILSYLAEDLEPVPEKKK
jgi:hypothetical protein